MVDIVHGPSHDISRGAANFFWDQVKGGRVAAAGADPHAKHLPSPDGLMEDGTAEPTRHH